MADGSPPGDDTPAPRPLLSRFLRVEPAEITALALSCAYFFCLLSGYYLLRPMRDAMGAAGGVRNIKWLFLGTLAGTLVASALFAAVASRWPRRMFIPWAYRFFALSLLVFFGLLRVLPDQQVYLGRAFFVFLSVFNVFVVSVFWSFMADLFTNAQGKRLFGFIAMGGSLGQVCGAWSAGRMADAIGAEWALLIAACLLELACWCVWMLGRATRGRRALHCHACGHAGSSSPPFDVCPECGTSWEAPDDAGAPLRGRILDGLRLVARSPYLLGICVFMLCYTLTSTFLYVTKLDIGSRQSADQDVQVAFFANIDFWTGLATIVAQVFLTSRVIARIGVGWTLALLPVITMTGFALLGAGFLRPEHLPVVTILVGFEALRRAGNYAFSRPAREVLYTVVTREEKYKAKNIIDTFVFRLGDQIGVWAYDGLLALTLGAAALAFAAVPLGGVWLLVALWLGRRQKERAAA